MPPTRSAAARSRRIAERLHKLRNLARDQAGTPEGETAARLARQLMREHARARIGPDRPGDPHRKLRLSLGQVAPWRRRLAVAVAKHCACVAAWPRGSAEVVLFGRRSSVLIAEYLLTVTLREVELARERFVRDRNADPDDVPAELRTPLNAFCQSAVTSIDARLRAMRDEEQEEDPSGHALVRQEDADVRQWLDDEGVELQKAAPSIAAHCQAGWDAGRAVPLQDAVGWGQPARDRIDARGRRRTRRW
jgi:hypothetical protein